MFDAGIEGDDSCAVLLGPSEGFAHVVRARTSRGEHSCAVGDAALDRGGPVEPMLVGLESRVRVAQVGGLTEKRTEPQPEAVIGRVMRKHAEEKSGVRSPPGSIVTGELCSQVLVEESAEITRLIGSRRSLHWPFSVSD